MQQRRPERRDQSRVGDVQSGVHPGHQGPLSLDRRLLAAGMGCCPAAWRVSRAAGVVTRWPTATCWRTRYRVDGRPLHVQLRQSPPQARQVLGLGRLAPGGEHVRNISLHLLGVGRCPGHQPADHPAQPEAGQGLGDLILLQIVEQLVVGGRAVRRARLGDIDRGRNVAAGPGLHCLERGQRLAHAARAGLDIGCHVGQEAAQVGGALSLRRPVREPDQHCRRDQGNTRQHE